jgi:hypothetical protein
LAKVVLLVWWQLWPGGNGVEMLTCMWRALLLESAAKQARHTPAISFFSVPGTVLLLASGSL